MAAGPSNYGPMTTNLDASESSDPNSDTPLSYVWHSGNGITATTSAPATSHTYAQCGKYTVTLTVRVSLNRSSEPVRIDVFPGDPSKPMIENLADESPFHVDDPITSEATTLSIVADRGRTPSVVHAEVPTDGSSSCRPEE